MIKEITNLGSQTPNSDLEGCDLPDNAITNALNFVLRNNKVLSFNGSLLLTQQGTANGGYLDVTTSIAGTFFVVAARTGVFVYNGTTWFDISNVAGYAGLAIDSELAWTGCKLGSIPIITNPGHFPEYWSPQSTGQKMQFLKFNTTQTWKDLNKTCKIIRSHNNFLFALYLIEGGVEQPLAYRWSHPADINGLPFTWDPADLSAIASLESLGGEGEYIVDGLSLRDDFFIYTNRTVSVLRYIGQDSPFVFERRTFSKTLSLLSTNCVIEAAGAHYLLTSNDLLINDGNSLTSLLNKKLRRLLQLTINPTYTDRCFAAANHRKNEIWFFIVSTRNVFPDTIYIVNYIDNTVSIRDTEGDKTSAYVGPRSILADGWNVDALTWDFDDAPWALPSSTVFDDELITLDRTQCVLSSLDTTDGARDLQTSIERTNLSFDGQENVTTITEVYPDIVCAATVTIELGSHDYVNSPVRWKPGVVFDPSVQRKADIRTTGKLHAWRVRSNGSIDFVLSGMRFKYVHNGTR